MNSAILDCPSAAVVADSAVPCRRLGHADAHHFFGYYNKTCWDRSDRLVLAQQTPWMDCRLSPDAVARVGYFDTARDDRFRAVGETRAWNWQMGSQLQWLDGMPGRQLIYNDRRGVPADGVPYPSFCSVIADIDSGERRELPLPVYVVAPDSAWALSVDYRRLHVTHETIGYSEPGGPFGLGRAPADDGIWRMDIATGEARLLVSYAALKAFHRQPSMSQAIHWVSHIEVNPASSRILFLHRWTERVQDETCFLHRLITMSPDGTGLRLLECSDHPLPQLASNFDPAAVGTFDYEKSEFEISHPAWKDDGNIVVWGPHRGRIHYHLYEDDDLGRVEVIGGGVLTENGHMSFSPVDQRWLLSDTYPDPSTHERVLFIYDMQSRRRIDIGRFYADPALGKENRCDLHPRWSRDGRRVCIDSVHEDERQMYVLDVSRIVEA
ncbi:MAG: hypothetical protein KA795_03100 [Burkholderiaceae bacterium]|nr:hypothetical protein [Burkholderiaceae bacterium]